MPEASRPAQLQPYLLNLYGEDPFAEVREASEAHRPEHARVLPGGEQECGVYASNPLKMRVIATIARATAARRILEIGGGLGYSALWLAAVAGDEGRVVTIDRFPAHVEMIHRFAAQFGLSDQLAALEGEGAALLSDLDGPFDLIHDDGWFAAQPAYYDRLADILRPGGLLIMSNWFLLEHAVTGNSPIDWALFAGPSWADDVQGYARRLSADSRYDVSFIQEPPMALAHRHRDD